MLCFYEPQSSEEPHELGISEVRALKGITAVTAIWILLNIVIMFYLFFHYMVRLKIFGKLILYFYALTLI